ncbi:Rho termination factor N-terminal domain-containing protein [Arthrobacter sp. GCM10027362]|uniref:Rho termination factor N-terminal domain-containing protein n=1 Tax=Arthrobacter sp. GCM10027362 TaxID=3273379 RepID=UPI003629190A
MADKHGKQAPNTPNASESELREMNVEELRDEAKKAGIGGTSGMKKDELVQALVRAGGGDTGEAPEDMGAGPEGGKVRRGPQSSDSLKYSQEVTSPDEEPEREGRSLVTTHHEVIRQWAEARNAVPATVGGTEHGEHLGVLRFDFGGEEGDLKHVSWEEWFKTFDERGLNFIYQEQRSDGRQSNFFRLENPGREDA